MIHGVVVLELVKLQVLVQRVQLVIGEVLAKKLGQFLHHGLLVGLQLLEPDVFQVGVIKMLGTILNLWLITINMTLHVSQTFKSYPEVLKVIAIWSVALAVQLGILNEVGILVEAVGRKHFLVVEEGHGRVLGVPGAENNLRGIKQVWRQHRKRQMGLDDALACEAGAELDRVGVELGHPKKVETFNENETGT